MTVGPKLTDAEIWESTGEPGPVSVDEWDRGIADAATGKMLSWCLREIAELATHFCEGEVRTGVELAAEELQERARLLITPLETREE